MNKVKVSEATNLQLDWLVAKCEGAKGLRLHTYAGIDPGPPVLVVDWAHGWTALVDTNYTTDWSQMGPIIEREGINTFRHNRLRDSDPFVWCCHIVVPRPNMEGSTNMVAIAIDGPTPLIAAARCYVMSKLGNEVEVPEELT